MPVELEKLSPLERLLHEKAKRADQFPERTVNYFDRYIQIKDWLDRNIFRNAGAGLARDGVLYTQHDRGHIEDVIHSAGLMLGLETDHSLGEKLRPFEVYVLLVSILLHDAGNAYNREGHEKLPLSILTKMGDIPGPLIQEKRAIAKVAQAHGGKTVDGNRDTITSVLFESEPKVIHVQLRARLVAAILRFADEISENPSRANWVALDAPELSPTALVHNKYCELIGIHVDPGDHTIHIEFHVEIELLQQKFKIVESGKIKDVYLIDYIAYRIEKADMERRYCNRFMAAILRFETIKVCLKLLKDGEIVEPPIEVEVTEAGYPASPMTMKERNSAFDGAFLSAKYEPRTPGGN